METIDSERIEIMTMKPIVRAVALGLLINVRLFAQPYDLSWHTVDGGGATFSAGGSYSLGGTIGQPDAGPAPAMTGGTYALVGGFWPAAGAACSCPGDMNGDMLKNGKDIQQFAQCIIAGGACSCADVDGLPGLSNGDVLAFVSDLLAGTSCP